MGSIGILLFGIAALVIGGLLICLDTSKKKKCVVEIEALVTDVKRKHYGSGKKASNDYTPILTFSVDGTEYSGLANVSSIRPNKFKAGQTMIIKYDPNDPDNFCVKGKIGDMKYSIGAIIFGVLFIVAYFYFG